MMRNLCVLLALSILAIPFARISAQSTNCPPGFPDRPALSQHVEQVDIISGALTFDDVFALGQALFDARFNRCDGQGRPATTGTMNPREPTQPAFSRVSAPDSNSCSGCHNQPRSGGAGDFVANVFVLAQAADPVLDTTSPAFSDNRNTLGMFGSGPIEMLAREMSIELQGIRRQALAQAAESGEAVTVSLDTKGVNFGSLTAFPDGTLDTSRCEGIDADLIVKPFHQAGVVASLREFSVNAMNQHHGMQAEERFDLNPAIGVPDFDQDGVKRELTIGDMTAVTIYQAALGVPGQLLPEDPVELATVKHGEVVFREAGCTSCHVPEMHLDSRFFVEPNPFNPPGTWADTEQPFRYDMTSQGQGPYLERDGEGAVIHAYTDLKRHDLCDPANQPDAIRYYCNEQLAQNRPDQDGKPGTEFFLTRKLWDVGNSAPYGHQGDLTTITEAILMHGGEARPSRDTFTKLPFEDQQALVSFLYSLQVLPVGASSTTTEDGTIPVGDVAISSAVVLSLLGTLFFRRQHRTQA